MVQWKPIAPSVEAMGGKSRTSVLISGLVCNVYRYFPAYIRIPSILEL